MEDAKMTDRNAEHRVHMTVVEARALGEATMRGIGYDDDEARILTDHVLDAALCGYEYSGLPKLLNVVDAPDFRLPRRPVTVRQETGVSAMIKATPRQSGPEEIRIPGERGDRTRERLTREGIEIDRKIYD